MIKSAFMLGAGLGLVSGMFLVKLCPKANEIVEDVKSKMAKTDCDCDCGCTANDYQ